VPNSLFLSILLHYPPSISDIMEPKPREKAKLQTPAPGKPPRARREFAMGALALEPLRRMPATGEKDGTGEKRESQEPAAASKHVLGEYLTPEAKRDMDEIMEIFSAIVFTM
jgi:hypothetical protein